MRFRRTSGGHRAGRWTAAILLVVAAGGLLVSVGTFLLPRGDTDANHIRYQRMSRLASAASGRTLHGTPDLARLEPRLQEHGLTLGAPVFIRIFKLEFELELWLERDGRYHRFATYPICRWSGGLGPKLVEGDRQSPEGFYTVDAAQLNPNSRWHRSFNLGFPNAFDRGYRRTGSFLMVHGGCSSVGCFAMTDPSVDEIWRIVTAALAGGQPRFHVHVFPFRLSKPQLEARASNPNAAFWANLAIGYEAFEGSQLVPRVRVCRGRYGFDPGRDRSSGSEPVLEQCSTTLTGTRVGRDRRSAARSPHRTR